MPSSAEEAQQARITATSRGYAHLTPSQVLLWRAYATTRTHVSKSGVPFTPNSYQAYSSLTAMWLAANGTTSTPPAEPPTTGFSPTMDSLGAVASAGSVVFTGSAEGATHAIVELWLQRLANANRRPSAGGYRVVAYAAVDATGDFTHTATVSPGIYVARYRFIDKSSGICTNLVDFPVSGVALRMESGGADAAAKPAARKKAA